MPRLLAFASTLLLLAVSVAQAAPPPATAAEARAFARQVVAQLNQPPPDYGEWGLPFIAAWYDPAWVALSRQDETLSTARHMDPVAVGGAICDCEHPGFRYSVASVTLRRDGMADFQLRSNNGSDDYVYQVLLSHGPAGWRVYNVVTADTDWRTLTAQHVACLRAARSQRAAERCDEIGD